MAKKIEDFARYQEGDTIWILVSAEQCRGLIWDWMETNYVCPLHVSKSKKHKGMFVVTTRSLMWASRIVRWIGYKEVTYKKI